MDLTSSMSIEVVAKALDGVAMRHTAITSNLANVDTPHYRRQLVSFEESLKQAIATEKAKSAPESQRKQVSNDETLSLKRVNPYHIGTDPAYSSIRDVAPQINETRPWQYRNDQNSVDIETEMVQLAKNTQKYLALSEMEKRLFQGLKSVISSGAEGG